MIKSYLTLSDRGAFNLWTFEGPKIAGELILFTAEGWMADSACVFVSEQIKHLIKDHPSSLAIDCLLDYHERKVSLFRILRERGTYEQVS